jgi:hypothetical protein
MKRFGDYTNLAGPELWEGPDHLLCIETDSFLRVSERYRRIDYKNIQAISIVRTSRFGWMLLLLTALAVLGGSVAFLNRGEMAALVMAGGFSGIMLLLLIIHCAKGATCRMQIQTAVQALRLNGIKRLKIGKRAMDRLEELCVLHQGGVLNSAAAVSAPVIGSTARPFQVKAPYPGSRVVTASLLLMLIQGLMMAADPFVPGWLFSCAWVLICSLLVVGLAIMVAKVSRYRTSGLIHFAGWAGVVMELLTLMVGYIVMLSAELFANMRGNFRKGEDFGVKADMGPEQLAEGFQRLADMDVASMGYAALALWIPGGIFCLLALLALPAALRPAGRAEEIAVPPPIRPEPVAAVETEDTGVALAEAPVLEVAAPVEVVKALEPTEAKDLPSA